MNFNLKAIGFAVVTAAAAAILAPMATIVSAQPATMTAPTTPILSESTIKSLQEALSKQGIAVKVDGILTDETRAAIRKYQSQHHLPVTGEPDKATLEKLGVVVAGVPPASQIAQPPTAPGTGPQPQMMQGMTQGMMAPGMMSGQTPMAGTMPMQQGMMMCPMMAGMMGQQPGRIGMMAPARGALGPGVVIPNRSVSVDDVREHFDQLIQIQDNPRVKLSGVRDVDKDSIMAEISTTDGSLVDRFSVNRRTGVIQRAK